MNKKNFILKTLDVYSLENELNYHGLRVAAYSELLAKLMKVNIKKIKLLKKGALLHDIGKKLIDKNIINKPSKLTLEEFEVIKKHPILGLKLLEKRDRCNIIKNILLFHHEKWNGKGYPIGLKGEMIPLEARIVSIADYYDALTSERVYKKKIDHENALKILISESSESFDPDIVSIFELFENKFRQILEKKYEN